MSTMSLGVDLAKYPTLAKFSNSNAYIRMLIGPAGSLKTSWCFNEILRLACLQEPDAEGIRRTRWVVIRNTFEVLKRATMETAKINIPPPLVRYTEGNSPNAKGRFLLGDGTSVDLEIEFLAVDTVDVLGKLLGYDYTGAVLDELTELDEEIIMAAARRAGRYPPAKMSPVSWFGAFGATNGPLESHWLYKWHVGNTSDDFKKTRTTIERELGRPYFEIFQQPPALLRPDETHDEWRPNPLAENVHNLPGGYGYYFAMLGGDEQKIAAYVEGKFSKMVKGKVVFPEFSEKAHVVDEAKIPPLGSHYLLLGCDFGRTPVTLVATETTDGTVVILDEITGSDMSVDKLFEDKVIPTIKRRYPKSKVRQAWGDPAGSIGGQATEASPFSTIRAKGIDIDAPTTNNQYEQRLDAVRWFLERTGKNGKSKLRISSRCQLLIKALREGYIYEQVSRGSTLTRETPTKSHIDWTSDLADALQYLCLGLRLRGETRKKIHTTKRDKNRGRIV